MTIINEPVTVRTDSTGSPVRLVWNGRRYWVSDTATQVEPYWGAMHVPDLPPVWRFQGTSEDAESLVFDVRFDQTRNGWQLIHVYD